MDFLSLFQFVGLFLFAFLFMGMTLYVRRSRKIKAVKLTAKNKGIQGILEISLFAVVVAWAIEVVMYARNEDFRIFPPPLDLQLIQSAITGIIGVTLVVLGFVICILALKALGASWRLGIDKETPGELVTSGIYAYSRNPIYIFFNLYFLGTFLINKTLIFLLFTIFVALNLRFQIRAEEKFLLRIHGPAYQHYRMATDRFFTWRKIHPLMRSLAANKWGFSC